MSIEAQLFELREFASIEKIFWFVHNRLWIQRNETISISFCPPSDFARIRKAEFISSSHGALRVPAHFGLSDREVSFCDPSVWLSELVSKRESIRLSIQSLMEYTYI